jgi:branched-chain amino acid transport system substrate-binding protein
MPIVRDNGPTMYCYTPGVHPTPGTYVFSSLIGARDLALAMVRWSRLKGWTRIAVISSTDSSGQDFEHGLDTALAAPENASVRVVDREHFAPADLSADAQITRIKAADPQVTFAWATGSPFGTVLHAIHDVGLEVPIIGGNGNMIVPQLVQYGSFLPRELYFPGVRGLAQSGTRAGPIRDKQAIYFSGLAKAGAKVSVPSNQAWDATWLVLDGYRKLGFDATANQFRDYLHGTRGWVGIEGVYDFSDPEQRGVTVQTCVIDRYAADREEFVPVSAPGGFLLGR